MGGGEELCGYVFHCGGGWFWMPRVRGGALLGEVRRLIVVEMMARRF